MHPLIESVSINCEDPVILALAQEIEAQEKGTEGKQACFTTKLVYRVTDNNEIDIYGMTLTENPMVESEQFPHMLRIKTFHNPKSLKSKIFKELQELNNRKYDVLGMSITEDFEVQVQSSTPMTPDQYETFVSYIKEHPYQFLSMKHKEDADNIFYFVVTASNLTYETPEKQTFKFNLSDLK